MARAFAAATILAAVLATAPASAESVCIHKDNCHGLPAFPHPLPPNIVGGGVTENFTVTVRLFGAVVLGPTGARFASPSPIDGGFTIEDVRVRPCGNGACGGEYGYDFDHMNPGLTPGSDVRTRLCVDGCSGHYGYTVFANGSEVFYHVYIHGMGCRVIAPHHNYMPQPCHNHP